MNDIRQILLDLNLEFDLLIKKYRIKNSVFRLPISHGETNPISMSCFLPSGQQTMLSTKEIEEALLYKAQDNRMGNCTSFEYYSIVGLVFHCKDLVKEYYASQKKFYVLQNTMEELLNLLCKHIGYNKHVGKFSITEFAEQINEKIEILEYVQDKTLKELILHDLDHMIFRLSTYCGQNSEMWYEHFKYLEESDYEDSEKIRHKKSTEVNIDRVFWEQMLLFCDDYLEEED